MKAIIIHKPNDKNVRCLIPVDNINCITEYPGMEHFITKIWLKIPVDGEIEIPTAESIEEIYEMMA